MGALASRGWRFAAAVGLAFATAAVAPMACIFPSYTFEPSANGGSGASSMMSSSTQSTGSAGGGTASTGSSSGATTSSSSSSGGPPCASQDCSDPTCAQSFQCVPTAPPAGTQYFALYDGMASTFPGCDGTFPTAGYTGNNMISSQQATCNCTCGTPTGQECELSGPPDTNMPMSPPLLVGAIDAIVTGDEPCGTGSICSGALLEVATWNGTCDGHNYFPGGLTTCGPNANSTCSSATPPAGTGPCNQSISVNALQVTGGSCTANSQAPTIPPVTWGTLGEACGGAMPGKGCTNTSDSCMPIPQAPFHSGLCIMQVPNVDCSGQFSETHVFYGSYMDSRSCTTCGCGAPTGGSCSATLTVYANTGGQLCTSTVIATLKPTSEAADCANLTGNPEIGSKQATFSAVSGGMCGSTAMPMGTATATNPTTFCCIP